MKRNRLHLVDVLRREINNRANAVVVDRIDDGRDEGKLNADARKILDRLLLHIKQVADAAVFIFSSLTPSN